MPFLKKMLKVSIAYYLDTGTLWVKNFDEIALSLTVKEIEAILCFATFGKNSKFQNGRRFGNFFPKVGIVYCLDTLGVMEIEALLCFATFGNSKPPPF